MTLDELNALPEARLREALQRCCGAARWVDGMTARRPFASLATLVAAADEVESDLAREDWLEAFTHHPRIGDISSLRAKFADTKAWASSEQSGAASASEAVLEGLAEGNRVYEERFGYIFIVCATGKSATEMLALLQGRLSNPPEAEWRVAAAEQAKITRLRLEKLLQ
ncbi:MAG TPA: 2-oxo-4-hydroxy-4-carboxy-5-ureidoimidazoline decarboxylase [Oscillatoriaceae cyanobacterium]